MLASAAAKRIPRQLPNWAGHKVWRCHRTYTSSSSHAPPLYRRLPLEPLEAPSCGAVEQCTTPSGWRWLVLVATLVPQVQLLHNHSLPRTQLAPPQLALCATAVGES